MQYVLAYLTTGVLFFMLDFVWLGSVAKSFYRGQIGELLLPQFNIPVAIGFYLVYIIGIIVFAVAPALAADSWKHALLYGALFGFFAYVTYDMTNLATLKHWTPAVVFVDVLWGTILTASSAVGGYFLTQLFRSL